MKSRLLTTLLAAARALLIAAIVVLPMSANFDKAHAAATTQTTHSYMCAPDPANGAAGSRRVVNPVTNNAYSLNGTGCAVIAAADIGYFNTQGYSGGGGIFTLQTTGIVGGSSGTASETTNLTLPAYGYIVGFIMCETAGNAVTGGLNIGDSGSATRFGSAVALGANACITVADSALTRVVVLSGVPTASTILLAAVTSWNSASVNVTVLYSFF